MTWSGSARPLSSAEEVTAAVEEGHLGLEETDVVMNAAVIRRLTFLGQSVQEDLGDP